LVTQSTSNCDGTQCVVLACGKNYYGNITENEQVVTTRKNNEHRKYVKSLEVSKVRSVDTSGNVCNR